MKDPHHVNGIDAISFFAGIDYLTSTNLNGPNETLIKYENNKADFPVQ